MQIFWGKCIDYYWHGKHPGYKFCFRFVTTKHQLHMLVSLLVLTFFMNLYVV